jgi:hypothetical protein
MLLVGAPPALAQAPADAPIDLGGDYTFSGPIWGCDGAAGTSTDIATCEETDAPAPEPPIARTPTPDSACEYALWYRYSGVKSSTIEWHHNTGNPGETIGITISAGTTVTGTVGGSGSFTVSAVVASAQAQVNASLALALTVGLTDSATWHIPENHKGAGRLYVGAQSNWMNWNRYRQNANCKVVRVGKGTANLPLDVPYFWHK